MCVLRLTLLAVYQLPAINLQFATLFSLVTTAQALDKILPLFCPKSEVTNIRAQTLELILVSNCPCTAMIQS